MKSAADKELERQWFALAEVFNRYSTVPIDRRTQTRFESLLDALFTCAQARRSKGLRQLEALLSGRIDALPPVRIWLALTRVYLARRKNGYAAEIEELDAEIEGSPPRTVWLVATRAAQIVWDREGPARAYQRLRKVELFAGEEQWQYDSALVTAAVVTTISLAIAVGAQDKREQMAQFARALWPEKHPSRVRIELMLVDYEIARGNFLVALKQLETLEKGVRGDLRLHLDCSRLHALVGSGRGESREARKTYREYQRAKQERSPPEYALPFDERRQLWERGAQVARTAGWKKAAKANHTRLTGLLHKEKEAKQIKHNQRRETALLQVLEQAEKHLLGDHSRVNPEELVRTKLLWCRLLVELRYVDMFDTCESLLDEALEEAQRLEFTQLKMLALDQRAVLRARKNPPDWKGAIKDSTLAASVALELLSRNADTKPGKGAERAFLAALLPILDRVVDLHAEGALRIAQRNPTLLDEPLGELKNLLNEESPQGGFLRFGRVIHTFAEQSQALALNEARSSFIQGSLVPHRLAVALQGEARVVVDSLMEKLSVDAAILQYFVVGHYLILFAYGRHFFDWHISAVRDERYTSRGEAAHRKLDDLLYTLRGWTQGERNEVDTETVSELCRWIWPAKIDVVLRNHGIRHLCIVPHDGLYRIPFGRIETQHGPLLHRFSMSIHPTGQLAAESAISGNEKARLRLEQGFVYGPEVDCLAQEKAAMLRAHGKWLPNTRIESIDGASVAMDALLERLPHFDLLHFLCHGEEGGSFGRSPALHIGAQGANGLELPNVLRMPMHRCALVVLQSCWTGWMDHKRTHPVQGFPQAFCDAGARAVIAPLTKIPQALAPLFTEVLYRTLRFLPAEQALQRTLSVLRTDGEALIAIDSDAQKALQEAGGMDIFEYRYTGARGLLPGHIGSRWLGRLLFWWWERRLRHRLNAVKLLT